MRCHGQEQGKKEEYQIDPPITISIFLSVITRQADDYELASVVVEKSRRRQGVGRTILSQIIRDFETNNQGESSSSRRLYAMTVARSSPFYENVGFRIIDPEVGMD